MNLQLFANIFANELFSTVWHRKAPLDTNLTRFTEQDNTRCHSEVLRGINGLYLLIRVSQVRDLYGLPNKTIPHPEIQTFLELSVTQLFA